jgi:hypothetical protein
MAFFFTCCAAQPVAVQGENFDVEETVLSPREEKPTKSENAGESVAKEVEALVMVDTKSDETQSTTCTDYGPSIGCSDFEESHSVADSDAHGSRGIDVPVQIGLGLRPQQADWWSEAKIPHVKGMSDAIHITKLLEARVIKHAADRKSLDVQLLEESNRICEELDTIASVKEFVSVSMNFG